MSQISPRQAEILRVVREKGTASSSEIVSNISTKISRATAKRDLAELVQAGHLATSGGGRSLTYAITPTGKIFTPLDALVRDGVAENRASLMRKALGKLAEDEAIRAVLDAEREPTISGDLRTLLKKF